EMTQALWGMFTSCLEERHPAGRLLPAAGGRNRPSEARTLQLRGLDLQARGDDPDDRYRERRARQIDEERLDAMSGEPGCQPADLIDRTFARAGFARRGHTPRMQQRARIGVDLRGAGEVVAIAVIELLLPPFR